MHDRWTFVIRVPKPRREQLQTRIQTLLLLTAVTAVLLTAVSSRRRNTVTALFGGARLSEQHLSSIELAWSREGLNEWERRGQVLYVPKAHRNDYLAATTEYGVPDSEFPGPEPRTDW